MADFFGSEELLQISQFEDKLSGLLGQTADGKIPASLRVKVLRTWLGYMTLCISLITTKARQFEDSAQRDAFVDLALKIFLSPKVSLMSAAKGYKLQDWVQAVKPFRSIHLRSGKSALNEILALLPAPLRKLAEKLVKSTSPGDWSKMNKGITQLIGKSPKHGLVNHEDQ
jgi:hypothetical protein